MNTKTEQNSSGLVAVAEVAFSLHLGLYAAFVGRRQIEVGDKLVRLSDAEAIIAQKDAEILEQCRINGMGAEREAALLGKVAQQSAALKLAREALAYHQSQTRPIHQTNEVLAAINEVLKGD